MNSDHTTGEKLTITVDLPEGTEVRADKYISEELQLVSRNQLKQRITSLIVNGTSAKLSKHIVDGDIIEVTYKNPEPLQIEAEPLSLDIVYEDEDLIVVNKAQGIVVHPANGNYHHTLIQGVMYHIKGFQERFEDQSLRPGIVHRIDKDTSGLVLIAKHIPALEYYAKQFRKRGVEKEYLAIVKGSPIPFEGSIETHIVRDSRHRKRFTVSESEGKKSITRYKVLKSYDKYSLVKVMPKTGRTHQIRVHLRSLGTPILGDPIYARTDPSFPDAGLMLHAFRIGFNVEQKQAFQWFRAPLPERFKHALRRISGKAPM
jgi:23S rRNA pseudouridine1911/1915/1917 synthase